MKFALSLIIYFLPAGIAIERNVLDFIVYVLQSENCSIQGPSCKQLRDGLCRGYWGVEIEVVKGWWRGFLRTLQSFCTVIKSWQMTEIAVLPYLKPSGLRTYLKPSGHHKIKCLERIGLSRVLWRDSSLTIGSAYKCPIFKKGKFGIYWFGMRLNDATAFRR